MTEPSDNTATRPISVAELLAKNGSIGSPAPGGRRRRRRGNADAVTVAELTGEIPIITIEDALTAEETPVVEEPPTAEDTPVVEETPAEPDAEPEPEPAVEPDAEAEPAAEIEPDAAEADYTEHLQQRDVDPSPLAFTPRRHAHTLKKHPHSCRRCRGDDLRPVAR